MSQQRAAHVLPGANPQWTVSSTRSTAKRTIPTRRLSLPGAGARATPSAAPRVYRQATAMLPSALLAWHVSGIGRLRRDSSIPPMSLLTALTLPMTYGADAADAAVMTKRTPIAGTALTHPGSTRARVPLDTSRFCACWRIPTHSTSAGYTQAPHACASAIQPSSNAGCQSMNDEHRGGQELADLPNGPKFCSGHFCSRDLSAQKLVAPLASLCIPRSSPGYCVEIQLLVFLNLSRQRIVPLYFANGTFLFCNLMLVLPELSYEPLHLLRLVACLLEKMVAQQFITTGVERIALRGLGATALVDTILLEMFGPLLVEFIQSANSLIRFGMQAPQLFAAPVSFCMISRMN